MRRTSLLALVIGLAWGATPGMAADKAPSFSKTVMPLLTKYCVDCHGATKPKAGVNVSSFDDLMKGKKSVVVAGKPEQSKLYTTMIGQGKRMPPRKAAKQPTAQEIAIVKAWIAAGAKNDAAGAALPPELRPATVIVDGREPARRPWDEAAEQ
jgi:hypothetical protein